MSVLSVRNVLPVVTSVAAALFLTAAMPHDAVWDAGAPDLVAQTEVQQCLAGGRDTDACLDEADGKALIERAEGDQRPVGRR